MKKIFLLICLLTGMVCMQETNLFGLQTICAEPQNAAPKGYSVTMRNQDMNFMYRDYDNRFSVSVPGVSDNAVSVTAQGAAVRKLNGTWIFTPEADAKTVKVAVFVTINGQKQTVANYVYRVKPLPKPEAFFTLQGQDFYSGTTVPRDVLLNPATKLAAGYGKDGVLNVPFQVVSFQLSINGTTHSVTGNTIPEEVLELIRSLEDDTPILICGIQVKTRTDTLLSLPPLLLTIH